MEKKYEITKDNFLAHEWIGEKVKVIKSSDKKRENINGIIINETQNTIWIEMKGEKKIVPKKECVFEFDTCGKIIIEGKNVLKRPEDRVKDFR
jgi:RNase P/RNase MRP subunit p29